jgi:hypothetical protein
VQDKRLKAAEALIKELLERQSEHAGALGPEAESALAAMPSDLGELSKPKRQEVALRRCCPLMVSLGARGGAAKFGRNPLGSGPL